MNCGNLDPAIGSAIETNKTNLSFRFISFYFDLCFV